jgi:Protein of unknown function (DUF1703).
VKYMVRGLKKSNDGTTVIRLGNIMYTIQMPLWTWCSKANSRATGPEPHPMRRLFR